MIVRRLAIIVAASVILCGMPAYAGLVTNGSFEDPDLPDGTNDVSDATTHVWNGGWTSADNNKGASYGAGVEDPAVDKTNQLGAQYATMKFVSSGDDLWIKILRDEGPVLPGTYSFSVGMTWDKAWATGTQPSGSNQWGNYNSVSLVLSGSKFERQHGVLPEDTFTDRSIQVVIAPDGTLVSTDADVAPAVGTLLTGGNVEIVLMAGRDSGSGGGGETYMLFDNVRLDAPVVIPEPAGLGLLGVALLAMRKRR